MKNLYKTLILSFGLFTTGCTDDFNEINSDPDAFSSVPYTNQLGYVITQSMKQWGTSLDEGAWAGYIAKIQYLDDYSSYIPTNNTYGNRWYNSYWGYTQLQDILDKTEENAEAFKNMRNACKVWQSYIMFMCTDAFGDIPYSQAWKGAPDKGNILQTPYDSQESVMKALLADLKTVADNWAAGKGSDELGAGDFLYNGDVSKWQCWCNSLRVRIAMRMVNVDTATARSVCNEVFGNPIQYPVFKNNDQAAIFWWQGSGNYYEPWYDNQYTGRDDHGLADIFIDHLKAMNDPRIASVAHPAVSDSEYRGYENGAFNDPPNRAAISRLGKIYRDEPAGFSPIFKACDVYYLMAEAALRGWTTPMSAEKAYQTGVKLSMEENKVSDSDAQAYLDGPGKWDNTFEKLYFESWVAMFKENLEAWSLYRRTGYPTYIHTTTGIEYRKNKDNTITTIEWPRYPGARSKFKGIHNDVPFRFPYPSNQYNFNETNVTAAAAGIEDYVWGKQVWWDTRTDVH